MKQLFALAVLVLLCGGYIAAPRIAARPGGKYPSAKELMRELQEEFSEIVHFGIIAATQRKLVQKDFTRIENCAEDISRDALLIVDFRHFEAVEEMAEDLKEEAERLHKAAREGESEEIVERISRMTKSCMECHGQFRD